MNITLNRLRLSKTTSVTLALAFSSGLLVGLPTVRGQGSAASINGTIRDVSGAVIPDAEVVLMNTQTSVRQQTVTDAAGVYVFVNIIPGQYRLETSKRGFKTAQQPEFTLQVNQTATFDFTLQVGTTTERITVEAHAPLLESSTAEVGAVIEHHQVVDLPLNGRNFTQLLELTPGVSPINVSQSAGGFGANITTGAEFTFPSVNGQNNRSNFYMLDGVNNYGSFTSTYAVPPIIDTIQEFKVQSHDDQAEFGESLGGIINVVSKSGTNQFHGDAWEFVRNDIFDAQNTFLSGFPKTAFRQNQFGVAGGGPVLIPKLYNGRNKTFFYGAYQGFRFRQGAQQHLFRVPTAANLAGDLSDDPRTIYNPYSTRPDPNNPGQFIRDPFPNNRIPSNLIDPNMVMYAQTILPKPEFAPLVSQNNANALDATPFRQNQREFQIRIDQTLGSKNSMWFRWSLLHQDQNGSGGLPSLGTVGTNRSYNWGVSYAHTFSPTTILQAQYGALNVLINRDTEFRSSVPANLDQQLGFNTLFTRGFVGLSRRLFPNLGVPNWWSGGEGASDYTFSNIKEGKANVTKVVGKHELKWGGGFATNCYHGICYLTTECFATPQTGNPEMSSGTGSELASFLLGVPNSTFRFDGPQSVRFGGVMSYYFQDSWKVADKLTVNLGLRYDATFIPPFGTKQFNNEAIGNYDLNTGDYVVQVPVPFCSQSGKAPCIPGSNLPQHVRVANGKLFDNWTDNWQPRLGVAYRLRPNTVLRGSFGIVFDNWAGVTENVESAVGLWPSIGFFFAGNVNNNLAVDPTPNIKVENPFPGETLLPAPTPFQQQSWFVDPHEKNAYSMQWNLGVQHQFGVSTVVTANYVGSGSRRLPLGGFYNTATTPGPGDSSVRRPYPYITPTYYDRSWGRNDYNAFQFQFNRRFSKGLAYMVSYTWSKAIDIGADGFYGAEGTYIQDPYHPIRDRSVAGFDLTNILSMNWVYDLPVGPGRRFSPGSRFLSYALGNWQFNGITTFETGPPYTLCVEGDIANTGNVGGCPAGGYEQPNYIGGNVTMAHQTPAQWFNTKAFATPAAFTFGNVGRNTLRADGLSNFDLSIFRQFPLKSEERSLQFRAEFFNAFNFVNYGFPNNDLSSGTFGQVTATANRARQIQLGLKLVF